MINSTQIKHALEMYKSNLYKPNVEICVPGLVVGAVKDFVKSLDNLRLALQQDTLIIHFSTWNDNKVNMHTFTKLNSEAKESYPNVIFNTSYINANSEFKDIVLRLLNKLNIKYDSPAEELTSATLKKLIYLYTTYKVMNHACSSYSHFNKGPEFPIDKIFLKLSTKTIIEMNQKDLKGSLRSIFRSILNTGSRHLSVEDYKEMHHPFDLIISYITTTSGVGDIAYFISFNQANKLFGGSIESFEESLFNLYTDYSSRVPFKPYNISSFNNLAQYNYAVPFEGSVILYDYIKTKGVRVPIVSSKDLLKIFSGVRSITSPKLVFTDNRFILPDDINEYNKNLQYDEYGDEYVVSISEIKSLLAPTDI